MSRRGHSQHFEKLYQEISRALKSGLSNILIAFLRERFPREAAVVSYFVENFNSSEVLKWAAMLERDMSFRQEFGAITQKMALSLVERGAARIGVFDAATQELRTLHTEFHAELLVLLGEVRENTDSSELQAELEALKQRLCILESEKQVAEHKAILLEENTMLWRATMQRIRAICGTVATSPASKALFELTYDLERGDEEHACTRVEQFIKVTDFYKPDPIDQLKATKKEFMEELEGFKSRGNDMVNKGKEMDAELANRRGALESLKANFESSQKVIERLGREFTVLSLAEDTDEGVLTLKITTITAARAARAQLKIDVKVAEDDLYRIRHEREQVEKEFNDLPARLGELSDLVESISTTIALMERRSGIVQFLEATVSTTDVAQLLNETVRQHLRDLSLHPKGFWLDRTATTAWGNLTNLGAFTDLEDLVESWLTNTFEEKIKTLGEKAQTLGPSRSITRIRNLMTGVSKFWKRGGSYQSELINKWIAAKATAQAVK